MSRLTLVKNACQIYSPPNVKLVRKLLDSLLRAIAEMAGDLILFSFLAHLGGP